MDRTVLITGANSGIGLATAIELGRRGFRSVWSVRSAAKAKAVAAAAAQAGVEVETVLLDVTDAAGSARVIDGLRPWGLVNNAGYSATGAIEDVSDDEARLLLETMVVAPMRLARLALPYMRAAGGGRIVNISSIYGRTTPPLMGDPAHVAAVIGRALTAWYPRARYLVGTDAQLIALTDMVLPTAVRDRLTRLV